MTRRLIVFATALLAVFPARAASLDDYLADGYVVVSRTTLAGSFTGCERGKHLTMEDGSLFACTRKRAQVAYRPPVTILARAAGPPSVVLVGGQAYAGVLARLGDHVYAPPLPISPEPPVPQPNPGSAGRIQGIEPGRSIDADLAATSKRLNDAQLDELPTGKRGQTLAPTRPLAPRRAPM